MLVIVGIIVGIFVLTAALVLIGRGRRRRSRAPEPIKLPGVKYHL